MSSVWLGTAPESVPDTLTGMATGGGSPAPSHISSGGSCLTVAVNTPPGGAGGAVGAGGAGVAAATGPAAVAPMMNGALYADAFSARFITVRRDCTSLDVTSPTAHLSS